MASSSEARVLDFHEVPSILYGVDYRIQRHSPSSPSRSGFATANPKRPFPSTKEQLAEMFSVLNDRWEDNNRGRRLNFIEFFDSREEADAAIEAMEVESSRDICRVYVIKLEKVADSGNIKVVKAKRLKILYGTHFDFRWDGELIDTFLVWGNIPPAAVLGSYARGSSDLEHKEEYLNQFKDPTAKPEQSNDDCSEQEIERKQIALQNLLNFALNYDKGLPISLYSVSTSAPQTASSDGSRASILATSHSPVPAWISPYPPIRHNGTSRTKPGDLVNGKIIPKLTSEPSAPSAIIQSRLSGNISESQLKTLPKESLLTSLNTRRGRNKKRRLENSENSEPAQGPLHHEKGADGGFKSRRRELELDVKERSYSHLLSRPTILPFNLKPQAEVPSVGSSLNVQTGLVDRSQIPNRISKFEGSAMYTAMPESVASKASTNSVAQNAKKLPGTSEFGINLNFDTALLIDTQESGQVAASRHVRASNQVYSPGGYTNSNNNRPDVKEALVDSSHIPSEQDHHRSQRRSRAGRSMNAKDAEGRAEHELKTFDLKVEEFQHPVSLLRPDTEYHSTSKELSQARATIANRPSEHPLKQQLNWGTENTARQKRKLTEYSSRERRYSKTVEALSADTTKKTMMKSENKGGDEWAFDGE